MPTAAPTLTAAPTSPDRADRATFAARAVALDDFTKNTQIPEMQAAINNAYANTVEAYNSAVTCTALTSVAAAAANYKGLWSTLTGALNMPASVAHNGNYWALNANLADVTAATPGVSASWQPLPVGAGGATETSSAVDVTLTAASYRVQAVAMTAADKSVNLPSATTLATGGEVFVVKNTGALAFCVRDAAGTLLAVLEPGKTVSLSLSNASTAAGVWVASGSDGITDAMYQAVATAVNAVAATSLAVTALSATQAIAVWGTAAGGYACTLNLTGNSISLGATINFSPAGGPTHISVCAMSATQAVVVVQGASVYLSAYTLNVSGTTLIAGALLTVNAVASNYLTVAALSATQAICAYAGTSTYTQACTLNVSGTTVTAGAVRNVNATASTNQKLVAMSSTQAVLLHNTAGTASLSAQTLNVSGTTVTEGAVLAVAASATAVAIAPNSATSALIGYTSSVISNMVFKELYVSGTTCSVGPPTVQPIPWQSAAGAALAKVSSTQFAALYPSNGGGGTYGMNAQVLRLSDDVPRLGPPLPIKTSATASGGYGGIASMSAARQLALYRDPSGYVQARVLETAA